MPDVMAAPALPDRFGSGWHFDWLDDLMWGRRLEIADKYRAMGIRHIRAPAYAHSIPRRRPDGTPVDWHGFLAELGSRGFLFNWIVGQAVTNWQARYGALDTIISAIANLHASYTASGEAPNEPDNAINDNPPGFWVGDPGWINFTRSYMAYSHAIWNSYPELHDKPYLGASLTKNVEDERYWPRIPGSSRLGDVSDRCDAANPHIYAGNKVCLSGNLFGEGEVHVTGTPQRAGGIHTVENFYRWCNPGQPLYVTEFGMSTTTVPATLPGGWPVITEEQQSALLLKQFLTMIRGGIKRAYQYSFVDTSTADEAKHRYGLLRSDLSEKPAYHTLKYLFGLCGTTAPASVKWLPHMVYSGPASLKTLLAQKGDGTYLLFCWREEPTDVDGAPVVVYLPTVQNLRIHVLGQGAPRIASQDPWPIDSNKLAAFNLASGALVLEIR